LRLQKLSVPNAFARGTLKIDKVNLRSQSQNENLKMMYNVKLPVKSDVIKILETVMPYL